MARYTTIYIRNYQLILNQKIIVSEAITFVLCCIIDISCLLIYIHKNICYGENNVTPNSFNTKRQFYGRFINDIFSGNFAELETVFLYSHEDINRVLDSGIDLLLVYY